MRIYEPAFLKHLRAQITSKNRLLLFVSAYDVGRLLRSGPHPFRAVVLFARGLRPRQRESDVARRFPSEQS